MLVMLTARHTIHSLRKFLFPMGFANQRTTRELFRGAEVVSLQDVLETCTYCDLLSAWSHKAFIFGLTHQH